MSKNYYKSGRTNQKLATRKKILSGAKYFIDKGEIFTLEDVAKKVKISRATIYRYYSNLDVLTSEAALNTPKDSESLYNNLRHLETHEILLGIQEYYNNFAFENENAFRKYLSIAMASNNLDIQRGARRTNTLHMALQNLPFSQKEKNNIANLLTILMGMEPLIVTKDVCGLDNNESRELLKWGLKIILKGISLPKDS